MRWKVVLPGHISKYLLFLWLQDAERMHLKAISIKEKLLGPEDYEVALSVGHLASLYNYDMHRYHEAERLYLRSIAIGKSVTDICRSSRYGGATAHSRMVLNFMLRKSFGGLFPTSFTEQGQHLLHSEWFLVEPVIGGPTVGRPPLHPWSTKLGNG